MGTGKVLFYLKFFGETIVLKRLHRLIREREEKPDRLGQELEEGEERQRSHDVWHRLETLRGQAAV